MTETLYFTSPSGLSKAAAWFEDVGKHPQPQPQPMYTSKVSQVLLRASLAAMALRRIKQGLKSALCDNSSP